MRLPDRYYDLKLERDQLLEEENDLLNQPYINYLEQLMIAYKIYQLDKELNKLEKECKEW
jgi:hypothetical protein